MERFDFSGKAPSKAAIDHLRTIYVRDPEVAVALDPDPRVVRDQRRAIRVCAIALKTCTVHGQPMIEWMQSWPLALAQSYDPAAMRIVQSGFEKKDLLAA